MISVKVAFLTLKKKKKKKCLYKIIIAQIFMKNNFDRRIQFYDAPN